MASTISPIASAGFRADDDDEYIPTVPESQQFGMVIGVVSAAAILIAIYANMLETTSEFWDDDTYSHGWLIPLIGLFLMWNQRRAKYEVTPEREKKNWMIVGTPFLAAGACWFLLDSMETTLPAATWGLYAVGILVSVGLIFYNHDFEVAPHWQRWVGVAAFVVALVARVFASQYDMKPADRLTFLVAAVGLFAAVGGFTLLKRTAVPLLFLVFMFPLPSKLEIWLLGTLQGFAAMVSTFILQILGIAATLRGSTITINELRMPLEVAEACSGLRMLTIFSAMTIALVLLIRRPWWDKLVLLLAAVPIALATNIIRITVTALLYLAVEGNTPEPTEFEENMKHMIHDYAGFAMIIVAMGFLFLGLKILENLTLPDDDDEVSSGASLLGTRATSGA